MFDAYKVAVKVDLINNAGKGLFGLGRQFKVLNTDVERLNTNLKKIKSLTYVGGGLIAGGAALGAPFLYAIDKAAELQKQMLSIQLATRGTNKEMTDLRGTIESISSSTIFNNIDVAKMAKIIATGTGFDAKTIQSIITPYAKYADVQYLMKGVSYEQSVTDAVRLAHTAGHYDAASIAQYTDLLNKASLIIPGNPSELGHALKYSQTVAKNALGIDDNNMVLLVALLNRLGFSGSRGGTNLLAAVTRSIPGIFGSGLLKGKSAEALSAMGMSDKNGKATFFTNGKFDSFKWMKDLSSYVQREFSTHPEAIARQDILTNFQHAFGVQGSRVAALLASPQALEQLKQIGETFSKLQDVGGMQEFFKDNSVSQQYLNAKNNFTTAMVELGITLLPMATSALNKFNATIIPMITWMRENPELTKKIAYGFLLLAGALAGFGILAVIVGSFASLAAVLGGPIVAALSALSAIVAVIAFNWKSISGLGSRLGITQSLSPGQTNTGHTFKDMMSQSLFSMMGSNQTTQVHTTVNLNGQKLGEAVTYHIMKATNKAPASGQNYSPNFSSIPTTLPGY